MPALPSALLTGLPPVLNDTTQILILGSFPGAASLAAAEYYAHPRNQLWRLLSALLHEDLVDLNYAQRLQRIADHHVGVGCDSCLRT